MTTPADLTPNGLPLGIRRVGDYDILGAVLKLYDALDGRLGAPLGPEEYRAVSVQQFECGTILWDPQTGQLTLLGLSPSSVERPPAS